MSIFIYNLYAKIRIFIFAKIWNKRKYLDEMQVVNKRKENTNIKKHQYMLRASIKRCISWRLEALVCWLLRVFIPNYSLEGDRGRPSASIYHRSQYVNCAKIIPKNRTVKSRESVMQIRVWNTNILCRIWGGGIP